MRQAPAWKRSYDRWSEEETHELIKAWAPLYICRRRGTNKDASVPLHNRGRARSSRIALVTEEWRAVVFAVNLYRAITARPRLDSCRTHAQCKDRVKTLRRKYVKGQAGPFFSAPPADEIAGRRAGAAERRGADDGGPAVGNVVTEEHDAEFDAAVGKESGGSGDASGGASVDGRGAAAEAARRRATFVPPPIPKRPRTRSAKPAVSSSASANTAVDDGEARVSEPAEPKATVVDLSAQALAAGFVDAAVVTKLAEIYKKLRLKVLDVEREKAAAAARWSRQPCIVPFSCPPFIRMPHFW